MRRRRLTCVGRDQESPAVKAQIRAGDVPLVLGAQGVGHRPDLLQAQGRRDAHSRRVPGAHGERGLASHQYRLPVLLGDQELVGAVREGAAPGRVRDHSAVVLLESRSVRERGALPHRRWPRAPVARRLPERPEPRAVRGHGNGLHVGPLEVAVPLVVQAQGDGIGGRARGAVDWGGVDRRPQDRLLDDVHEGPFVPLRVVADVPHPDAPRPLRLGPVALEWATCDTARRGNRHDQREERERQSVREREGERKEEKELRYLMSSKSEYLLIPGSPSRSKT